MLLAAVVNGDEISAINAAGLVLCLAGIALHVVLKALDSKYICGTDLFFLLIMPS